MTTDSTGRYAGTKESASNLVDLVRWRAGDRPEKVAFTFLEDGESKEIHITYEELDRKARSIGARLQSKKLSGKRVMLLYPTGMEFITAFLGCLYAGAVAVPAPSPRHRHNLHRLQTIAADAEVSIALTTRELSTWLKKISAGHANLDSLECETIEDVDCSWAEAWKDPGVTPAKLAFLQYTSGSTAQPKGVMVSHGNLMANERSIQLAFQQSDRSLILGWLPLYHDMGLIGNIFQTLYAGARCILLSPASFLQEPLRWLKAITRYKVTTSGGPNFAYDLCVQKISPEQRQSLDLSRWKVAFNGSEPIRPETLDRFAEAFEPCGFRREAFYPCYGLAEATLLVTGGSEQSSPVIRIFDQIALGQDRVVELDEPSERGRALVSCGRVFSSEGVRIVDPRSLTPCRAGEVGEIWVTGNAVAQGYFGRSAETEFTFGAQIANSDQSRFLRTGDLGFLFEGELFVTGRIKDLIIVRGFNHYPHDLEETVARCHQSLRPGCGAVFSVDFNHEERVVVAHEIGAHNRTEFDLIFAAIRRALASEHGVQVYAIVFIRRGTIPKTTSGKIQRQECRQRFMADRLPIIAEWRETADQYIETWNPISEVAPGSANEVEQSLILKVAAVLKIHPGEIKVDTPLTMYGFDSLAALELMYWIEKELGIQVSMESLLGGLTIGELAQSAPAGVNTLCRITPPAGETGYSSEIQLSHGQKALWFIHQMNPTSAAYNVASAVRIKHSLDVVALRSAFQKLGERHASLRTTFSVHDQEPMRHVNERFEIPVVEQDATRWTEEMLQKSILAASNRQFDLQRGPLFRVEIYHKSEQECVMLLVANHIIVDFWSLAVLTEELNALYAQEVTGDEAPLPSPRLQYSDYVGYQAALLASQDGELLRSYWRKQLDGDLPTLNLPTDRPRPPVQTFNGASFRFKLGQDLTRELHSLVKKSGATLYMALLAAFQVLLHRYTGQEEIIVGSPVAGRNRAEWANIVGYFVNPLVLRAHLSAKSRFDQFLDQTRQVVLGALAHQEYPFSLLVEQLQPQRSSSHSPLFQAMFILQKTLSVGGANIAALALGEAGAGISSKHLTFDSIAIDQRIAQFDLTLSIAEQHDELMASLQYNTDLFDASTIARIGQIYRNTLESIIADPSRPIYELQILNEDDYRQILVDWNSTEVDYGRGMCLHRLFELQAESFPDDVAVIFEGQKLTNRELDRRANQVASRLRKMGVGSDVPVGICLERSLEMVIGLLAILKAGGAYVPIDPAYPSQRQEFMLNDSGVPALITQAHIGKNLPFRKAQQICLDSDRTDLAGEYDGRISSNIDDESLAYIIYTSGSTGTPKGAMITHRGICNRLHWMQKIYQLTEHDRVLQKTPFSFDVSVWEFFWPLATRACLIVARPAGHQDPDYLRKIIDEQSITTVHFVPSMLEVFLDRSGVEKCQSLRRVISSGEALPVELQKKFFAAFETELHNLYGPTEASVDVTYWECKRTDDHRSVPIGRPIDNMQIFILDEHPQPVPVGVNGELYIGGIGIARGYLNKADLTAEKFVPHPFSSLPGERLYRTGDLARYLPEGEIEFLSRIDDQIKIRGFRVELGEIEYVLNSHPSVRESIITAQTGRNGEKELTAYLATRPDSALTSDDLRTYLKTKLPEYMVPASFAFLEEFPLTPNGKLDRKLLTASAATKRDDRKTLIHPRTPLEEKLVLIWKEILGLEEVGVDENFFELGGHSLLITKIATRVRETLNIDLPVRIWFDNPTVASQANVITERQADQMDAEDISTLLTALDQMTEEEVELLLVNRESFSPGISPQHPE